MAKGYSTVQPKNPSRTKNWRGGAASSPGGAHYKGANPSANNPAKRGASRGR